MVDRRKLNVSVFLSRLFPRRKPPMPAVLPRSPAISLPPPTPPPKDTVRVHCQVMKPLPIVADSVMPLTPDCIRCPPRTPSPPHVPPKTTFRPATRVRLSPEERLKRQRSLQRHREREEQDAIREEHERQARRKREKTELEQTAREEEARRKAVLQDQLKRASIHKAKQAREAEAAEEARLREIRERKQMDHERRLQYTHEMQKWRQEYIRRIESQSSEREEGRKRSAEERRSRIRRISDAVFQDGSAESFNGWLTIQTPDHLAWKRRYFMFDLAHSRVSLCRNQRDSTTRSIELINLDSRIESFNEWYEGFEELEAIPHSFAVKFVDGHTWLLFADTEQDKDRLLVLLSEAAGVII